MSKCNDCNKEVYSNHNMVMLNKALWEEVSKGNSKLVICDQCIEQRMNRPIELSDLLAPTKEFQRYRGEVKILPCNMSWLMNNFFRNINIKLLSKEVSTSLDIITHHQEKRN